MRTIFFALAVAAAVPAQAGSILLVEFGWNQPQPVTLPANYFLAVNFYGWDGDPAYATKTNPLDYVTSYPFEATATDTRALNRINASLSGNPSIAFMAANYNPATGFYEHIQEPFPHPATTWTNFNRLVWNDPPRPADIGVLFAHAYVPRRGNGLVGYQVDRIERFVTAEGSGLRLFGFTIPEPPTAILLLAAVVMGQLRLRSFPRR